MLCLIGESLEVKENTAMTNSTPPWELTSPELLSELLCGDADAVLFMRDVGACTHVYDDLIDNDKPVPPKSIHSFVWIALVQLPVNPFYRRHQDVIRPVLMTSILNWHAANEIEAGKVEEELRISHALRYSAADILLLCMEILGGHDFAMRNARRARLMLQHDTWANYISEHQPEDRQNATPAQASTDQAKHHIP